MALVALLVAGCQAEDVVPCAAPELVTCSEGGCSCPQKSSFCDLLGTEGDPCCVSIVSPSDEGDLHAVYVGTCVEHECRRMTCSCDPVVYGAEAEPCVCAESACEALQ